MSDDPIKEARYRLENILADEGLKYKQIQKILDRLRADEVVLSTRPAADKEMWCYDFTSKYNEDTLFKFYNLGMECGINARVMEALVNHIQNHGIFIREARWN